VPIAWIRCNGQIGVFKLPAAVAIKNCAGNKANLQACLPDQQRLLQQVVRKVMFANNFPSRKTQQNGPAFFFITQGYIRILLLLLLTPATQRSGFAA